MLSSPITTNIVTADIGQAKRFYCELLGLELVEDMGSALRINAGGAPLFIYERQTAPRSDATIASWQVENIRAIVHKLVEKGVQMQIYDGFGQDEDGIASRGEEGPFAAWFKDPDENILGLIQP